MDTPTGAAGGAAAVWFIVLYVYSAELEFSCREEVYFTDWAIVVKILRINRTSSWNGGSAVCWT